MASIAEENNIGYSTIQRWLKAFNSGKLKGPSSAVNKILNKSKKLDHIIATSRLDEVSLGAYCRKHGFYSHQLQEWRNDMIKNSDDSRAKQSSDLKLLRQENLALKKELKRKEKALAEASALLILKKKPA